MLNTCDSCIYWGDPIGEAKTFAVCKHPKMNCDGVPALDGVAEADTNGYDPGIYYGAKFGCIHYQRND